MKKQNIELYFGDNGNVHLTSFLREIISSGNTILHVIPTVNKKGDTKITLERAIVIYEKPNEE
jgi:hypothetical protein